MALERIERHTDMTQTGHQANHPLVSVCMLCYNSGAVHNGSRRGHAGADVFTAGNHHI